MRIRCALTPSPLPLSLPQRFVTTLRFGTKTRTPRSFRVEHQRMMLRELGLNPKKVDNGNGLGLGEIPRCAITGKPSNCSHLYNVGLVFASFFRFVRG